MKHKFLVIVGAVVVAGAVVGGALYAAFPVQVSTVGGLTRNYLVTLAAPPGSASTELNADYKESAAAAPSIIAEPPAPGAAEGDWPSYNRTLLSQRFSPLNQIDTKNVGGLKVLCTYNVGGFTAFESGLIMVNNALIGTTSNDIFSIDPATCAENWRTHEDYPLPIMPANRGAAYMDGMLFRGTQDGRVLGYDFKTGKRLWQTTIADSRLGESVPSAPIAWNGLVFVGYPVVLGNAGADDRVFDRAGVDRAKALVVTTDDPDRKVAITLMANARNPALKIAVTGATRERGALLRHAAHRMS
jgi:alcohol dehydrogenase (cytochrome c)